MDTGSHLHHSIETATNHNQPSDPYVALGGLRRLTSKFIGLMVKISQRDLQGDQEHKHHAEQHVRQERRVKLRSASQ